MYTGGLALAALCDIEDNDIDLVHRWACLWLQFRLQIDNIVHQMEI